jgi:hypothetical protein
MYMERKHLSGTLCHCHDGPPTFGRPAIRTAGCAPYVIIDEDVSNRWIAGTFCRGG